MVESGENRHVISDCERTHGPMNDITEIFQSGRAVVADLTDPLIDQADANR